MSVQRYDMHQYRDEAEMEPHDQGDYVLYTDHRAELERVAKYAAVAGINEGARSRAIDINSIDAIVAGVIGRE